MKTPHHQDRRSNPRAFFTVFAALLHRPRQFLRLWNWKAGWLSLILRGPIFMAVAIPRGFRAAGSAVLIECAFCTTTAGFYGAIVQTFRDAEPEWLTLLFLSVFVPGIYQLMEFLLQRVVGTPHLLIAEIISGFGGGIAALFNWYVMRRGTLLVGEEGGTFTSDLRRFPRLLIQFAAEPLRWLMNRGGGRASS